MASAIPVTHFLSPVSLGPVHDDDEGRIYSIKRELAAPKSPFAVVEEVPLSLLSVGLFEDFGERKITIEEDDKVAKNTLVQVEEVLPSATSLETVANAENREVSTEERHALHKSSLLVAFNEQTPRYHEDDTAHYCLPNDFQEHVRLETQAMFLSKMMGNKVFHAPIDTTATRVLDVGCGTGIVTHLMSDAYPQATCIGLDLSETPQLRPQAANVRFFKGNVTAQRPTQWTTADGKSTLPQDKGLFDYIFSRLLILGMSDWQNFLKTEYGLLKPGGWAEIHDLAWDWYDADGTVVSDEWSWLRCIRQELEHGKGMDLDCGKKAKAWMEEAGFVDIQVHKYTYPFCGSSESSLDMRDFGRFNTKAIPIMLDDVIPRVMGNACSEKKESLGVEMCRTLLPGKKRHQVFFVTVGRKPFAFEQDP